MSNYKHTNRATSRREPQLEADNAAPWVLIRLVSLLPDYITKQLRIKYKNCFLTSSILNYGQ
jgi:hypothetical protein